MENNEVFVEHGGAGEKRLSPLKAIRAKCLECSGTWHEVKLCTVTNCALYPYRFGKNPYRTKREYTEEELERIRERFVRAREARAEQGNEEIDEIFEALDDDFIVE